MKNRIARAKIELRQSLAKATRDEGRPEEYESDWKHEKVSPLQARNRRPLPDPTLPEEHEANL